MSESKSDNKVENLTSCPDCEGRGIHVWGKSFMDGGPCFRCGCTGKVDVKTMQGTGEIYGETCSECGGTGLNPHDEDLTNQCGGCGGKGWNAKMTGETPSSDLFVCPECDGGLAIVKPVDGYCPWCGLQMNVEGNHE